MCEEETGREKEGERGHKSTTALLQNENGEGYCVWKSLEKSIMCSFLSDGVVLSLSLSIVLYVVCKGRRPW